MSERFKNWAEVTPLRDEKCRSVLRALAELSNEDGRCTETVATIADTARASFNTVRKRLHWLRDEGKIEIFVPSQVDTGPRPNRYRLLVPVPA